ncbi:MAG: hypothetical protein HRU19_23190 [Pseudobacteriovorax sp.]|nr:hypothetical protein [Pseudobacteriovorax sp.]
MSSLCRKIVFLTFVITTQAFTAKKDFHSAITHEVKLDKKNENEQVKRLTFKILPEKDHLIVTESAPWEFKIIDATDGVDIKKRSWSGLSFVKSIKDTLSHSFLVTVKDDSIKPAKLTYSFTTFLCTSDKTLCYREIRKNSVIIN